MAYSTLPTNPTSHTVAQIISKLHDADSDLRYMALNDLHHVLQIASPSVLLHDPSICARTIDGLLHTLNDTNGEVQNMAVKCLGPFANKVPETVLYSTIDKISGMQTDNAVDHSVPALALRAIIVALPRPVPGVPKSPAVLEGHSAISRALIPRLIGVKVIPQGRKDQGSVPKGMLQMDIETGQDSNAIDVLTEIVRGFGTMLQDVEIQALQKILVNALESERTNSVLKKKAVATLAILATYFTDSLLSSFISRLIESFRNPHLTHSKRKLYITVLGSLARAIPRKFGPYLKTLTPFVLSAVSSSDQDVAESVGDLDANVDIDEVREAALITLDSFVSSCAQDMLTYKDDCIKAGLDLLKYDPNVAIQNDDEDFDEEEDNGSLDQEEFDEEQDYGDEDDESWKVRRCAAKLLRTILTRYDDSTLLSEASLYDQIAPVLVSRLTEPEESVRLELLSTLSSFLKRAAKDVGVNEIIRKLDVNHIEVPSSATVTRKRRRGQSDATMDDLHNEFLISTSVTNNSHKATPQHQSHENLNTFILNIVRGLSSILKRPQSSSTKQAVIVLLKDIVTLQPRGLQDSFMQISDFIRDTIKGTGNITASSSGLSATSVTAKPLRIHALQLISLISRTHPSDILKPKLSDIVAALVVAVQDRYGKLAVEALTTIEHVISALSVNSGSLLQGTDDEITHIYDIVSKRVSTSDVDTEVRQHAIQALGFLISRLTGLTEALSREKEMLAFETLSNWLEKETTRLASARSVELVASSMQARDDVSNNWVRNVSLKLASQLRKALRSLRFSSLQALRAIVDNPSWITKLDNYCIREITGLLIPLLGTHDLQLVKGALLVTSSLVNEDAKAVASPELNNAICTIVQSSVAGSSLEALLTLVRSLAENGEGKALMVRLLKEVGIGGNLDTMGKSVGTLLVFGGNAVGYKTDDFVAELKSTKDEKRKCLALSILGQAGLLLGSSFSIGPDFFVAYLSSSSSTVSLSAAVALGRAGASNVSSYLPRILSIMETSDDLQYPLLHSVKETLQQDDAHAELIPYTKSLWDNIISASRSDDNRAIGAECIGRLARIDPGTYLPQLQEYLNDKDAGVRGMVISALRYTLADSEEIYNDNLGLIIVQMLNTMLNESDIENRRLALTTLSSAAHNKPKLMMRHLDELLPLALKETNVHPELIRDVQMGPFRHKVDDGLELRKSAYETLYALLENLFPLFPVQQFYDRIVAGLTDQHDICALCILILTKLIHLAPDESRRRLGELADAFRHVLSVRPKENAVKTEIDRMQESQKGVMKVSIIVQRTIVDGTSEGGLGGMAARSGGVDEPTLASWKSYWDWAKKSMEFLMKEAEDDIQHSLR